MRAQQGSNGNGSMAGRSVKSAAANAQSAGQAQVNRLRVLAVLDGSEQSEAVVDYLVGLGQRGIRIDVILLNIQPRPSAWQARAIRAGSPAERITGYRGKRALDSARKRLELAGIAAAERVEVGDAVPTIVRCASETSAGQIVIPMSPAGPARRWLARHAHVAIASVAAEVAELSPAPVVIVNRRPRASDAAHS